MVEGAGEGRLSKAVNAGLRAETFAMRLPKCRLFLITPAGMAPAAGGEIIAAALKAGDVASLLITEGPQSLELARHLKPICHAHDTALLFGGDARAAKILGLDGVQLEAESSAYAAARALLGDDAIIGADCGASRHLAMTLGEAGASYIGFSGLSSDGSDELIAWWSELFELPCVALDPAEESQARAFIAQGADFIRPADEMWRSGETAARAVRSYNVLIEETLT
jgi:thiamine-phosphate pyrophosphorylase